MKMEGKAEFWKIRTDRDRRRWVEILESQDNIFLQHSRNSPPFQVSNCYSLQSFQRKKNRQCMAENPSHDKEVSVDLARELLIAISECQPDTTLSPKSGEQPTDGEDGASVTGIDKIEELRSELISISYVPSPEKIALPANGHP